MSHLTAATGSNIGPLKGLSRMRGNSHVRFLGEPRSVMALAYPTALSNTVDAWVYHPAIHASPNSSVLFEDTEHQAAESDYTEHDYR